MKSFDVGWAPSQDATPPPIDQKPPLNLSSAYRCKIHNKVVGGVEDSPHPLGRGVDIPISGLYAYTLLTIAISVGFTGIGIRQHGDWSKRFIHLDNFTHDKRPRIWTYT